MGQVVNSTVTKAIATNFKTTIASGAKVVGYNALITPTPVTPLADLNPLTVPGMEAKAISFTSIIQNPDNSYSAVSSGVSFAITDPEQEAVVNGFVVYTEPTPSTTQVLLIDPLVVPVNLAGVDQGVIYVGDLTISIPGTNYGKGTVIT